MIASPHLSRSSIASFFLHSVITIVRLSRHEITQARYLMTERDLSFVQRCPRLTSKRSSMLLKAIKPTIICNPKRTVATRMHLSLDNHQRIIISRCTSQKQQVQVYLIFTLLNITLVKQRPAVDTRPAILPRAASYLVILHDYQIN